MADQSVRVEGDSGSAEAVAFKLWAALSNYHNLRKSAQSDLELYAQCLNATKSRSFDASKFT